MARAEPLFTIITINFNNAAELERTISSVAAQKFAPKEYLIVDGGSTDNSPLIMEAQRTAIDQVVSEPDRGIYDAMNKGVALARGEWILFLNSGDSLAAEDVLNRIAEDARSPEVDILLGSAYVRYSDGTGRLQEAERPEELIYGMICSHQAMLARRRLLVAMPFTIGKMRSDYAFALRAWRRGLRFKILDFVIAEVAAGGWSDRDRISSLRERWALLREEGAVTTSLMLHFGWSFSLAVLSPMIKSLLPDRTISMIRTLKLRYLGTRSSRG